MKMVTISMCEMNECFYNDSMTCHAQAINVGGPHQMCDTFIANSHHGGDMSSSGSVGACKVEDCSYNESMCCSASEIQVGHHENHADCMTYKQR